METSGETSAERNSPRVIPCVGAIISDADGRILLIKRGHAPQAGRWSLPGGRIEAGETDQQALVREVREETGLEVRPGELTGAVQRPAPGGATLDIRDYRATVTGGDLAAGDDADDARWAGAGDLAGLPLTSGLLTALTGWGVFGSAPPALIADATRRAGLMWLSVPGQDRPYPAWHVWGAGVAYLVTGPGEQPLPGLAGAELAGAELAGADLVGVTVTAGTGEQLVTWQARAHRVEPGSPEWEAAAGLLVPARLNGPPAGGEGSPARRWATAGAVYGLTPVS